MTEFQQILKYTTYTLPIFFTMSVCKDLAQVLPPPKSFLPESTLLSVLCDSSRSQCCFSAILIPKDPSVTFFFSGPLSTHCLVLICKVSGYTSSFPGALADALGMGQFVTVCRNGSGQVCVFHFCSAPSTVPGP